MKIKTITLSALLLASSADANVKISSDQTGEAILIPFYTVANGLNSNITVTNTSEQSKLAKIIIRDNKNSELRLFFNLFLKGHDSWTAALAQVNGKATLISNDASCSTLSIQSPISQELFSFITIHPDEQFTEEQIQLQMEVGSIEIYELATIKAGDNPINTATNEFNCAFLLNQYSEGGLLAEGSDVDAFLTPAENSLRSTLAVFDVANGYSFTVPAIHFNGFFADETFMNEQPDTDHPNLSDANNISQFSDENGLHEVQWDEGYMAISALLMKSMVGNDFVLESNVAAATEWVVTFPTLKYHTNDQVEPFIIMPNSPDDLSSARFRFPYPSGELIPFLPYSYGTYDREGRNFNLGCSILCPPRPSSLDHAVNVLVASDAEPNQINRLLSSSENKNTHFMWTNTASGKIELYLNDADFSIPMTGHYINTNEAFKLEGLPVVGFSVQRFINGNAQPGLLAKYVSATSHYWKRSYSNGF